MLQGPSWAHQAVGAPAPAGSTSTLGAVGGQPGTCWGSTQGWGAARTGGDQALPSCAGTSMGSSRRNRPCSAFSGARCMPEALQELLICCKPPQPQFHFSASKTANNSLKKMMIWNGETTIKYCFSLHRPQTERCCTDLPPGPLPRHFFHNDDFWNLGFTCTMAKSRTLNKAGAMQKPGTALALDVPGWIKDKPPLGWLKGWSCRLA